MIQFTDGRCAVDRIERLQLEWRRVDAIVVPVPVLHWIGVRVDQGAVAL
jgi:hypothetical protein